MYHYYYDGTGGEPAPAQPAQAPEEPAETFSPEPQPEPEPPEERRPRRRRSEGGAAAILLLLTLVLGGLAVALAMQAKPVDISAWSPSESYDDGAQTFVVDLELQRYPNGDGTTLTLADRPETATLSFQRSTGR